MSHHTRTPAPSPSDFRKLREGGFYYVDKTGWLIELLERGEEVVLLPRPRRFGKTLNLSTLRYYLDCMEEPEALDALFSGLAVQEAPEHIRVHRGRYPVVLLSLKDVKGRTFEACLAGIQGKLGDVFREHRYLLDSPGLLVEEQELFKTLMLGRASEIETAYGLSRLTRLLWEYHGERAVVLIDEYDAPIEAGYAFGYYEEVVDFLRNMMGAALKDNRALFRGVLTGVRRISKESLFSGLNNVVVFSLLSSPFSKSFGFTEDEVTDLLDAAGRLEELSEARRWYNGYLFGGVTVYNPWSILSFAATGELKAHWAAPSSDEVLRQLLTSGQADLSDQLNPLLAGEALTVPVDENVVLRELDHNPDAIWSFLLFAGYLKARSTDRLDWWHLSLPNLEVRNIWSRLFSGWLLTGMGARPRAERLTRSLLRGDEAQLSALLSELVANVLSTNDSLVDAPERVYHLFALGLLAWLEPEWQVRSEREAGLGRADVLVLPNQPGRPGAVLEFKRVADGGNPENALNEAAAQLRDRNYAAEVTARGATAVHQWAVAFRGKQCWVRLLR